jgi:hypothetical protein
MGSDARWFDSPQLHEKWHLPGEMLRMDEGIVPPSKTLNDQGRCDGIVALTSHSTVETSASEVGCRSRGTEIGRMTSGVPSSDAAPVVT